MSQNISSIRKRVAGAIALALAASAIALPANAATVVGSITAQVITSQDAKAGTNFGDNGKARIGANFVVGGYIYDESGVITPGVDVTATVTTNATLTADKTLTVAGGTPFTDKVALAAASFPVTSDETGVANLTLLATGYANNEKVTVTFTSGAVSDSIDVTLLATKYTVNDTNPYSTYRKIAEGGSVKIDYLVKDDFSALPDNARLKIVTTQDSAGAPVYVDLVGGEGSYTVADAGTANTITAVASLQTRPDALTDYSDVANAVSATDTVVVATDADAFDAAPAASFSVAIDTNKALKDANTNSISVNNPGAEVTVSAEGVTFTIGVIEYEDTVNALTGANGDLAISAKSRVAGPHTITFTTGTNTATTVLNIAEAASNKGETLAIEAPAKVAAESIVTITGSLDDVWGNPVAVTNSVPDALNPAAGDRVFNIVYDGPGRVLGGVLPTGTNASGNFIFRIALPKGVSGKATATVTYDADGDFKSSPADAVSDADKYSLPAVVATTSFFINDPATAKVTGGSKKLTVLVKNAKDETIEYVIGGKKFHHVADSNAFSIDYNGPAKGKKSVKVLVSGVLVFANYINVKK